MLAYVRTIPTADRTSPAALDALQLADVARRRCCPPTEAKQVRKELGELGVRVIRARARVTDQMLFDKDRIVVQAGKPVEIVFENTDLMPHNFVVTQPGALEEIGLLAEATGDPAGRAGTELRPAARTRSCSRAGCSHPRESQKLSFTAPTKPGVYPYVCTYPGHWRRMYGAFYVVEDLDEYLADPRPTWPPTRCRSRTSC